MSYGADSWMMDSVVFGDYTIKRGDKLEIYVGRSRIECEFISFDRLKYAFVVKDIYNNEIMIIPYKSLKMLRIINKKEKEE
jgi:hypothetical protein